jgi:hypothetical protein
MWIPLSGSKNSKIIFSATKTPKPEGKNASIGGQV